MLDDHDSHEEPAVDMSDGGSVLARYTCVGCGAPFVPRTKRHTRTCGAEKCRDRALYLNQRLKLHAVIANQERRERWGTLNAGYQAARASLRKRGLLTSETAARCAALKGQGPLSTEEALRRVGLDALIAATRAKPPINPRNGRRLIEPCADAWRAPSPAMSGAIMHAAQIALSQRGIPRQRVHDFFGARMLHGAIHRVADVGHDYDHTAFSIALPTARGGALWLLASDPSIFERLPRSVLLGGDSEPHDLTVRAVSRIRSPAAREPGQYRARVIAAGPIVIKRSARVMAQRARDKQRPYLHELHKNPTDLAGPLSRVAARIGLQRDPATTIIARVTSHDLEQIEGGVRVGTHWKVGPRAGVIECLVGTIDVECNALGRWLLDVAALIGLGSKTSIGFGRVRVEDL